MAPVGVHTGSQGSQTDGTCTEYSNPPVPGRLVTQSPLPGNMLITYPDPLGPLSRPGLGGQSFEIRADSPGGVQFCWLPFQPLSRSDQTHSGEEDSSATENQPSVRLFMSIIGLLTATEKQLVSG